MNFKKNRLLQLLLCWAHLPQELTRKHPAGIEVNDDQFDVGGSAGSIFIDLQAVLTQQRPVQ